jgi:hypothetical protein
MRVNLESTHRPRAQALNRAAIERSDAAILFDPIQTLPYGVAETKRFRRIATSTS